MNWVDYIIIAIFFLSVLAGFSRGFVKEVVSLLSWIVAFIVASKFSSTLAAKFTADPTVQGVVTQASSTIGISTAQPVSYAAIAISFGLLFAGTVIIGSIIGYFLNMIFQVGILGLGNRILGAAFGFARGFLVNLVVIFIIQLTPLSAEAWWRQSQLVGAFQPAVQWLGSIVSPSLANLKSRFGDTIKDVGSQIQGISNTIPGGFAP